MSRYRPPPPAPDSALHALEQKLGVVLPPVLKACYAASNGGTFGDPRRSDGEWQLHPVFDATDRKQMKRTGEDIAHYTKLALKDARIRKVLAVGLAGDVFDLGFVAGLKQPTAFVHADRDEYGKLENIEALIAQVQAPHRLFVVPDSDHLCTGRLDAFGMAAKQAFEWLETA
jgi:fermentation-respiration switch protein FrsA (DUF1100 family)